MNERIKQLAEQAGADFMRRINYNNLEGKEYEEDAGVIFESNESFEKFAELIVREMLVTCEEHPAWTGRMIGEQIKQHFGVDGMSTEDKKTLIKELLGVKNETNQ
jgi:hypothetical protein